MPERAFRPAKRLRRTSAARQLEIVAAVLELARDRGPDAITTHAIADRVGVTQGAVFRHFPDKEAIWLAVFAWVGAELERVVGTAVDDAASPLANLERIFVAHVGLVASNPGLPRMLFHELQTPGGSRVRDAVRTIVTAYRRRLTRLFDLAKAAGEVSANLDTALAPVLFIGAVQGLVIDAALGATAAHLARRSRPAFALLRDGWCVRDSRAAGATRGALRTLPPAPRATR
jgi:AcrR family transcriptional regulator